MPRVDGLIFLTLFTLTASMAGGEEARPVTTVEFIGTDGARHEGEIAARTAAGFTLRAAEGEKAFRWDGLGPEISYGLFARLIGEKDGQGWLDAAYLLETMKEGSAWADRALEKAVSADPAHARAAAALRAERIWFAANPPPAETAPEPEEYTPPVRRTPPELGDHILAIAVDHPGQLWIGTEERGLWVENPRAPEGERWRSFRAPPLDPSIPQTLPGRNHPLPPATAEEIAQRVADKPKYYETPTPILKPGDFPEDTVTALAVDRMGRVWAGHLRHGVSVWNGESWKTYEQGDGPLGHRVFDMKINPLDGDVWIATEVGLTRYRPANDQWTNYTMADGLASHQVVAFAFDPNTGDLWTGYDAYGVGRAARDEHGEYPAWENFRAPASFAAVGPQPNHPSDKTWPMPNTPTGEGLPSDFINDIAVDRDGAAWVATHLGLAWSKDHGETWRFQRGRDWEARVNGLYQPPVPQWTCRPQDLWMETDHVQQLTLDERGVLWAGFWRKEWRAFLPGTNIPIPARDPAAENRIDFATVLLPTKDGLYVGTYGQGVREIDFGLADNDGRRTVSQTAHNREAIPSADSQQQPSAIPPPHPSPAPIPSTEELAALLTELKTIPAAENNPPIVALPDDWRTRGDWLGRYGKYWSVLAGLNAPNNYVWGAGEKTVRYRHFIGPHKGKGDSVRHWVSHLNTTDPRSLEMPPAYYDSRIKKGLALPHETRRQSEWDDHSEAYPYTWNGPHLYCTLRVPEGEYVLSLYNFNKDGLDSQNRFRDYPIAIKELPAGKGMTDLSDWDSRRELARGRFHDFRGGVWKRWYVKGPRDLTIELQRNSSWSTILAAVTLDDFNPFPDPYFNEEEIPALSPEASLDLAHVVLAELDALRQRHPAAWGQREKQALLALSLHRGEAAPNANVLDARLHHALSRFDKYEDYLRALGLAPPRELEKSLEWDGISHTHYGTGRRMVVERRGKMATGEVMP